VGPTHRVIEIFGYLDESLDFIEAPTEELRLMRKCPRPDLDFARSRAVEATEERRAPMPIGEHDVVALRTPTGGWPAGTQGTVIHNGPIYKLVEVSNHLGEDLAFLEVPAEQLRVVWRTPHRCAEVGAD
jgi:hypothetical protein